MKVLVTGGAGFIGYHTCKELLAADQEVVIFDDFSTGRQKNIDDLGSNVEVIEGDITEDSPDLVRAIDGVDAIIHLAARVSVRESVDSPGLTSKTNVHGFINVADKARLLGVKRFVFASSAAIYGDCSSLLTMHGNGVSTDAPDAQYNSPISPYGLDKLTNEAYADLFNKLYKMQTIGLRYFNVYGPRQDPNSPYAGVIGKFISKALVNEPITVFGDGEQTRNFVYVEDIAKVNVAAALGKYRFDDFQGFLNVGKPDGSVSLNKMIRMLNKVINQPITVGYQDFAVGDVAHSRPELKNFIATYSDYTSMRPLDEGLFHLVEHLRE